MNRVNVFAIHRCINEGYGLIQIFTEKIRISPTKLWRVCKISPRESTDKCQWMLLIAVMFQCDSDSRNVPECLRMMLFLSLFEIFQRPQCHSITGVMTYDIPC